MKKFILILLVLIGLTVTANAEVWECRYTYNLKEAVRFTIDIDDKVAILKYSKAQFYMTKIIMPNKTYNAVTKWEGLARRIDFGDEKSTNYSIILKSDGDASYYDFTTAVKGELVKPSEHYRCRKVK